MYKKTTIIEEVKPVLEKEKPEPEIIVQIEVWDRFDHSRDQWFAVFKTIQKQ